MNSVGNDRAGQPELSLEVPEATIQKSLKGKTLDDRIAANNSLLHWGLVQIKRFYERLTTIWQTIDQILDQLKRIGDDVEYLAQELQKTKLVLASWKEKDDD